MAETSNESYRELLQRLISANPVLDFESFEACQLFDLFNRQFDVQNIAPGVVSDLVLLFNTDSFFHFYNQCLMHLSEADEKNHTAFLSFFVKIQMVVWKITNGFGDFVFRLSQSGSPSLVFCVLRKMVWSSDEFFSCADFTLLLHLFIRTLLNITSRSNDPKHSYPEFGVADTLLLLLRKTPILCKQGNNDSLQTSFPVACLLLLALLTEPGKLEQLDSVGPYMVHLINALWDALNSSDFFSIAYMFHAADLLRGLYQFAESTSIKKMLLENNVLYMVETALSRSLALNSHRNSPPKFTSTNPTEINIAENSLKLLWSLAFVSESHQYISPKSGLRELIERFLIEPHWSKECKLAVNGILFNLGLTIDPLDKEPQQIVDMMKAERMQCRRNGHIVICYECTSQPIMMLVRNELQSRGVSVWMSLEYIDDFFVNGMADAIQSASALLLGVSKAFAYSSHCRREVMYAYIRKIPFYPILLDKNVDASEWLKFILTPTEPIILTNVSDVSTAVEQLCEKLDMPTALPMPTGESSVDLSLSTSSTISPDFLKNIPAEDDVKELPQSSKSSNLNESPAYVSKGNKLSVRSSDLRSEASSPVILNRSLFHLELSDNLYTHPVHNWSKEDVSSWLTSIGLAAYVKRLSLLDGPLLIQLCWLRCKALESLSISLRTELGMNLIDLLRLYTALADLKSVEIER